MRTGSLGWRGYSILSHRYLGMLLGLLFLGWFLSGVVMMYARMPRFELEERMASLPELAWSGARLSPLEAFERTGLSKPPERARLGMHGGRPVYRFLPVEGAWVSVFADDGSRLAPVTGEQAVERAAGFITQEKGLRWVETLHLADQWTLDRSFDPYRPLHRLASSDRAGTEIYVSGVTGELVLKTTRRQRCLAYAGAIIHWLYMAPLRRETALWRRIVIGLSILGCALCLGGLFVGLWRLSLSSRYRFPDSYSASPYAGSKRWHHWAGLLFGPFAFTWIASGLLSMGPWGWSSDAEPTARQRLAFSGGLLEPALFTVMPVEAIESLRRDLHVKELDLIRLAGEPYYLAQESPRRSAIVPAQASASVRREFSEDALLRAAQKAMPGFEVSESEWLEAHDAYYYGRDNSRPLPVLRVKYADPLATWLYIDPRTGQVALWYEKRSRLNRWIYPGLHSLDFPFLYRRRPLWDVLVIFLSLGGTVLTMAALVMSWRRIRRGLRRAEIATLPSPRASVKWWKPPN